MTELAPMRSYSVLAGVRVIELGQVVAAPHAGLLLAAAGADVIKVERPPAGDDTRRNAGFYPSGASAYFVQQNWGKRSIVLDLAAPDGRESFARLLGRADVLIENLRPGAIGRLGFGWDQVSALNPALVMCSISAFGQTGPDAPRPGYGALAEARAGLYEMTGDPGGPPVSGPLPVADMMAAGRAFGLICAALVARERTGRGDYLDVSLLECAVELQDWAVERFVASDGRDRPTRRGQRDDALVPWGQFATADGWIVLIVSADRFWPGLAPLIGLSGRPDLAAIPGRRVHAAEIYAAVEAWAAPLTCDQALAQLSEAGVPAERVATVTDLLADPQLHAREMFAHLPGSAGRPVLAPAMRFASGPSHEARDAPALGQHTNELLAELAAPAPAAPSGRAEVSPVSTVRRTSSSEHNGPSSIQGNEHNGPSNTPRSEHNGPSSMITGHLEVATFRKTLSETDLLLFAGLSGDLHPVHVDETSSAAQAAGGRTIHAVFLIGLMSTATSQLMQRRGLSTRLAGLRELRFHAAAHPGDTVAAAARLTGPARDGQLAVVVTATADSGVLLADGIVDLELS